MIKTKDYFQSENFGTLVIDGEQLPGLHTHDFDELVFVLGGTGIHYTKYEEYKLVRGDVYVISGNQAHGFKKTEKLNLVNILYNRNYFKKIKNEFQNINGFQALFVYEPKYRDNHKFETKLHLTTDQLDEVLPLINLYVKELTQKREGYTIAADNILRLLILEISRFYSTSHLTQPRDFYKIVSAIGFMEKNFHRQISVQQLANISNMNRNDFYHLFKKTTGSSPIKFLIRIRVKKAAKMLTVNPELNITDALISCGFENSSYFTRQFKKIMGITPREFVKQKRNIKNNEPVETTGS